MTRSVLREPTAENAGPEPPRKQQREVGFCLVVWTARLAILAAFLGVWQWYGGKSAAQQLIFSTPSNVASTMTHWVSDPTFWLDLRVTLTEAVLGYFLGVTAAVAL